MAWHSLLGTLLAIKSDFLCNKNAASFVYLSVRNKNYELLFRKMILKFLREKARIFHFMTSVIYVLFIQAQRVFLSISKFQQTQDKKDWVIAEA